MYLLLGGECLRRRTPDAVLYWYVTRFFDLLLLLNVLEVVDFPELDVAARRRLWLGHFGLNDPVANCVRTFSSSTVDQKEIDHSLLLRDIEKLSRHQLDGKPHVCH